MEHVVTAYLNTRREAMLTGFCPADVVTPSEVDVMRLQAQSLRDAASLAFAQLNDRPGATERSLSEGDVVHVLTATHDVWLSIEGIGFDLIDRPVILTPTPA